MSITRSVRSRVPGSRRPLRRSALAVAAAAGIALAASACASSGNSGSGSTSSGGPDVAYFHGKTITLIAPDNPGGSFDEWARVIAPEMGKYLGATVNVENIPAGNTVVGQNTLAAAQPNGLTIGWLNAIEDVSFGITGGSTNINFDPTSMSMLGAPGQNIMVWVSNPSSAFSTWQSITSATAPVNTLSVTSGTATLYAHAVYGAYSVNHKFITGYESSKLLAASFLRHDAPVASEEFTVFSDAITANEAKPVLISSPVPSGDAAMKSIASVPTIAQEAKSDPPTTAAGKAGLAELISLVNLPGNILAAPKGVPANELAALQAAAKAAFTSATVSAQAQKEGLSPGFFSAADCLSGYQAAQKNINVLKPYMAS